MNASLFNHQWDTQHAIGAMLWRGSLLKMKKLAKCWVTTSSASNWIEKRDLTWIRSTWPLYRCVCIVYVFLYFGFLPQPLVFLSLVILCHEAKFLTLTGNKWRWRLAHERVVDPWPSSLHWRHILPSQRPWKKTRAQNGSLKNHGAGISGFGWNIYWENLFLLKSTRYLPASYQQLRPEYVKSTSNKRTSFSRTCVTCFPQWQNNRSALESSGERILETLKKGTTVAANPGEGPPPAPDVAKRCFQQLANSYEEEYGGFRDAPKFPSPGRLCRNHRGFLAPHCPPDSPFLFAS